MDKILLIIIKKEKHKNNYSIKIHSNNVEYVYQYNKILTNIKP